MRKIYLLLLSLILLPYGMRAQDPSEGYTINYEAETITIAEGYSLYAEQTGGEAIFTSNGENNTTSLTNYIQNTEQKLYLQAPATGGAEQPDRRAITIPARPQAPTVSSATIDYSQEKISAPPGMDTSNWEYSTNSTAWNDVPSGMALSEMGWDGNTPKTYYFRTGATDTSFASSQASTTITAPARPAKPAEPALVEVTSNSITIEVVSGQEYRLGSSGEWKTLQGTTGSDGKTVYTYNNLAPGTQYTIETRTPAETTIANKFASHPASITVTTKYETDLGGLEVSGNTGFQGHFQYGDVITVTFTPERKENNSTNALAENTATLTYTNAEGESVTLATATAQADGSFKLTYDTKKKELPIGEDLSLTVSYGGSGALNPVEESVTLTLDQAYLRNIPTVTGSFVYGETLTISYTPQDDETVTYQWWRIIDDEYTERIDGATGKTYTPTEAEIGRSIYVFVDATDDWHYGKKQSDQYQISKAPGNIKIACESVTYGEAVQPSVSSNTNEGANVTYSYEGTDGTSYGPSSEAPKDAGTYTVTATVAETATHTSAESEPVTFTIAKAIIDEEFIKAEGETTISLDLETESLTLTAYVEGEGISNDGEWKWESEDKSIATVTPISTRTIVSQSSAIVTVKGAGTVEITAIYATDNYVGSISYTLTVTEPEPEEPDPTPLYYNIQFEDICEGVDASLSKSVVKEGNQVSVYVEVEEGYDGENLKVLFKRSPFGYWEEVEEGVQPGEYIIYNVYNDIYVKVEGVEKIEEEPTGMSDIESTKVYAQNGNLYVYTSQPQEVMIITMNGTILRRERQEGLRSYSLPKGVYIICIGEERYKIAVR